jgi:acyl carrier protein
MTREEIIIRLMSVVHDTFDDEDIGYSDGLTARDVQGWDSLSNIPFMVAVETAFDTRFSTSEWESLRNLGELVDILMSRDPSSKTDA